MRQVADTGAAFAVVTVEGPELRNLLLAMMILFAFCALTLRAQKAAACSGTSTRIDIIHGSFSPSPGVQFQLRHFRARSVPLSDTAPLCYQKLTIVSQAEIFIDNDSLTTVFRNKLGASGGGIRDFTVSNGEGTVTLNGSIVKIIPIHFSIEGPVTTDGVQLQLHASKIKADGIPVKALLQIVGDHLSTVLSVKDVKGISVNEDSISFSPEQIAHLKGYIVAAEPSRQGLTLRYGRKPKGVVPATANNASSR